MSCEHEDRLVELVYDELSLEEGRALRKSAEACPHCSGLLASLEEAKAATEVLSWIEAPDDLDAPILAAARAQAEANRAHAPSMWTRIKDAFDAFTLGPQVAMATVMMLVVAIGLWYVPEERESHEMLGQTVVAPDPEGRAVATTADEDFREELREEPETIAAPASAGVLAQADGRAPARVATRATASRDVEDVRAPEPDPRAVDDNIAARENVERVAEEQNRGDRDQVAMDELRARAGLEYAPSAAAERPSAGTAAPAEPVAVAARPAQPTPARQEGGQPTEELVPAALFSLARRHRENDACPTATQHYEDLIRRFPDAPQVPQALVEAADCFRRMGSTTRARELLERAERYASTRAVATRELRRLETLRAARRRAAPSAVDSFDSSEAY